MQRERLSEKGEPTLLHKFVSDSPAHRTNYNTRFGVTEQPLPPNGACLLGSFNLTKYCLYDEGEPGDIPQIGFDWNLFRQDIAPIVRMMDNVIDNTIYPLEVQEKEAKSKRRMGLGITGVANAIDFLGWVYGSEEAINFVETVMTILRDEAYHTSVQLAKEKGPFPLFDGDKYPKGEFIRTLPLDIQAEISEYGIRNSHLLSIAPTGTISLWAGNISSGIEPVFAHEYDRMVYMPDGSQKKYSIQDYGYSEWGIKGLTSGEISAKNHIDILCTASRLVDSSCSKTCNVGENVDFDEFKELYLMAYEGGASGCTTFRPSALEEKFGKGRGAVLTTRKSTEDFNEGAACFIDPITGERSCSD